MTENDAGFVCQSCGSPSIELPGELNEEALVSCGRCHQVIGSWHDYKRAISRSICAGNGGAPAWSADPIVDLAVTTQKR